MLPNCIHRYTLSIHQTGISILRLHINSAIAAKKKKYPYISLG
jgi:hypothetical protein